MNLQDLNNRVDANRSGNAAVNRAAATADPAFDAGMADDPFDSFDDIDSGGAFGGDSFGGDSFGGGDAFGGGDSFGGGGNPFGGGDAFGGGGFGGGGFGLGGGFGQQPQQAPQSTEDKIIDAAGKAGKASIGFFKEFAQSFKGINGTIKATWGRYASIFGAIIAGAGVLVWILLKPNVGLELTVGGLLSTGIGIMLLCFGQSEVSNNGGGQPQMQQQQVTNDFDWNQSQDQGNLFGEDNSDFGDEGFGNDEEYGDEGFSDSDDWGSDDSDGWDSDSWDTQAPETPETSGTSAVNTSAVDAASAISALDSVASNGLVDRRTLFERQMSVLRNIKPDFATKKQISESDQLFGTLDAIVQDAAEMFKPASSTEIPYLIEAIDTLFYIRLEISRPKYIKNVQQYTQEIVNVFQFDKATGTRDASIYGIGEFVGNRIYIKLMKGETAFVSLKDIYDTNSEEILDYNNKMPIVMGVNIEGMPVMRDFFNIESILITGAPRTGKSWFMLAILYQMMAYMSPEELNFYLFDPKGLMSDLTNCITPHVKAFVSDDAAILGYLRYIVNTLGAKRKEDLGVQGYKTIKDYNNDHPEKKMPYIYVVIDEVVTLADRMEDDVKKEFQGLLTQLVSQLPAAGIRLFMVPHLVKDQIIKKTTTQLIPCRVSVMGNAEHIENSCGIKNFPHKLEHVGDMCVALQDCQEGMFVHAVALAKGNDENTALFKYLGALWAKVCPDSVPGSVYERMLNNQSLLDATSALPFMTSAPDNTPHSEVRKAGPSRKTKASPSGPSSASNPVYDALPNQYANPFGSENAANDGSWGHNNITDNGNALNEAIDIWGEDL